jgi:4,5-dihydroxyphthalate decarboxylase
LPLKNGQLRSDLIALDFVEMKPVTKAFKPMVREQRFDVSELALATFLQAKAYNKPLILLPATVMGRFQHGCMLHNAERGRLTPSDLAGRRVGVRAYSQTTGVWLRGILQNDYGVDLSRVHWVTFEDAHVAEYKDPAGVERAADDKNMTKMLQAGELDAAIYGSDMPDDPRLQSVIPAPDDAARAWYDKHGVVPVNHMVAVTEALARSRPDFVIEIYRMLCDGKKAAKPTQATGIDTIPFGYEANKPAIEMMTSYMLQQGLIVDRPAINDVLAVKMK